MKSRKVFFWLFILLSSLLKLLERKRPLVKERTVVVYPLISSSETLAEVLNKVAWYLPKNGLGQIKIRIPVAPELMDLALDELAPPSSFGNYLSTADLGHIELVEFSGLREVDHILCWNWKALLKAKVIPYLGRTYLVDPEFYSSFESETFKSVCQNLAADSEQRELDKTSERNFERLLKRTEGRKKAFIFCTGPSISKAFEWDYRGGIRIACNSIIKNDELMAHIRPHVLAFADPVFHFSPCRYASEFRKKMVESVRDYDCFVVVPGPTAAILIAHYPELRDRIIGMQGIGKIRLLARGKLFQVIFYKFLDKFNFPTPSNRFVKNTHNITTSYMLPIASTLAEESYVVGADGRKPDEKYFWKHSSSTQYDDLMQTVFDAHPSFFRDRSYADYYAQYCRDMEKLFQKGEKNGRRYYSLTPSHTPALKNRQKSGILAPDGSYPNDPA